jgi:hypothetical protein
MGSRGSGELSKSTSQSDNAATKPSDSKRNRRKLLKSVAEASVATFAVAAGVNAVTPFLFPEKISPEENRSYWARSLLPANPQLDEEADCRRRGNRRWLHRTFRRLLSPEQAPFAQCVTPGSPPLRQWCVRAKRRDAAYSDRRSLHASGFRLRAGQEIYDLTAGKHPRLARHRPRDRNRLRTRNERRVTSLQHQRRRSTRTSLCR